MTARERAAEIVGGVPCQPRRFHDGGLPGEPPDRDADPRIVLERVAVGPREQWAMLRRIGYDDRYLGELLVPADVATFRTDMASVPSVFTWLVPRSGEHLPAALLHDGLFHPDADPPTYVSTEGHRVLRAEANRVFRDAMADTGTGVVRRWLVWSAVTAWTMLQGSGTGWSAAMRWRYRLAVIGTLGLILALGWCATFDLIDVAVPFTPTLPWMGDRSLVAELVGGLAGAIVVPFLLGLLWGRFAVAGVVSGLLLAVLVHVTVLVGTITAGYQVAERVAGRWPFVAAGAAVAAVVAAAVLALRFSVG